MLLHYHPQHRPLLADIVGHPWIQGDTATSEQIREEFNRRLETVKHRVKEEQD